MIIKLGSSVGNNLDNSDDDVRQVKKAFSRLKMFDFSTEPEPHGYMTHPFRDSILKFQKENSLKVDGKMFPGGETEKYLNKRLMSEKGSPVPKVEKGEILPPPKPKNIPGTNIPDEGIPEGGMPRAEYGDHREHPIYKTDRSIWRYSPYIKSDIDSSMEIKYHDHNDPIKNPYLKR